MPIRLLSLQNLIPKDIVGFKLAHYDGHDWAPTDSAVAAGKTGKSACHGRFRAKRSSSSDGRAAYEASASRETFTLTVMPTGQRPVKHRLTKMER